MEVKNLISIKNDASFRRYFRIDNKILMDADPNLGEDVNSFININNLLQDFQLNVPKIYSIDKKNGFLLLEDFGENVFSKILDSKNEGELYKKAIEVLTEVHKQNLNEFSQTSSLEIYSIEKLLEESQLFIEWYLKKFLKLDILQTDINDFTKIINKIFYSLDPKLDKLVFRDYHVDNLIYQNSKLGLKKVGILDFQDAVVGQSSYDLASILADVRRPITEELKDNLIDHFTNLTGYNLTQLKKELTFYSVQRNLKILGIFCRLRIRDNKPNYMAYNENAWINIKSNLSHPMMADLKDWLKKILPNEK